jgi:hypothetical protein
LHTKSLAPKGKGDVFLYSSRRVVGFPEGFRLDEPEGPAMGVAAVATRDELRVSAPPSAVPEGRIIDEGLRAVESLRTVWGVLSPIRVVPGTGEAAAEALALRPVESRTESLWVAELRLYAMRSVVDK